MNDTLLLGPTSLGEFVSVAVRGIHRKRMPVKEVRGGQTASFALKKVTQVSLCVLQPRSLPTFFLQSKKNCVVVFSDYILHTYVHTGFSTDVHMPARHIIFTVHIYMCLLL